MKTPAKKAPARYGHETLFHSLRQAADDAIARRAYELFAERGGEHGHHLEDWLAAQQELVVPAPIEATTKGSDVVVRVRAPGFGLADLEWDIQEHRLSVVGRQERTVQGSDGETAYSNTRVQYLLESIELPALVEPAGARITMVNDVVEVRLPQRQPMARPATHAA